MDSTLVFEQNWFYWPTVQCLLALPESKQGGMLLVPGKTFRLTLAALHSAPAWLAGKEFDRNFLRAFFLPDHIFEHSLYRCLLQQQLNTILEFQAEQLIFQDTIVCAVLDPQSALLE